MASNGSGIANGKAIEVWKVLEIVILVLLSISVGLSGWNLSKTVDLGERIAAIEANRFTAKDGLEVWRELGKKADSDNVPPPEVIRRLDSLERQLEKVNGKLGLQ